MRNALWQRVLAGRETAGTAADGWWAGLVHYPWSDRATHRGGYAMPAWLDRGVPWVGSLERLYAIGASWPGSVSPEAGLLLYALARNVSARVVVETGTYMGVSTHWIAAALADAGGLGRVHCFDKFDALEWAHPGVLQEAGAASHLEFVRGALGRAGLGGLVELHEGDSPREIERAAPTLRKAGVQLAFLDGDHTVGGVLRDFLAVEPLLDTGGYLVLHDVFPDQCGHEGPRQLLERLSAQGGGRYAVCGIYTSPHNYGMAVLQRLR